MPTAAANGIDVFYEERGDPGAAPLLLVMGFTAQLTSWPDGFVDLLAGKGFRVIRYDNRDVGLSSKIEGGPPVDVAGLFAGTTKDVPYSLGDMAADGIGLLDALGIDRAHVVGASMGGMIAQTMAVRSPDRLFSLCSIMSTTGDPAVGGPSPVAAESLLAPAAPDRDSAVERAVVSSRIIGSPGYPADEAETREKAGAAYDRCFYPAGVIRQLAAIVTQPDRTEALGAVRVPTLVVHGADDALVDVSGGKATAAAVPGAELLEIPGMGHDIPTPLWGQIVDAIAANAAKA